MVVNMQKTKGESKMRERFKLISVVVAILALFLMTSGVAPVAGVQPQRAENVILLIGDGMSLSTITATRIYKVGPDGNLNMDTLKHHGWISTHSLNSMVTDSAAAGTAIATGRKTNNGFVGMMPDRTNLKSILDIARGMGKSTGLVTTTEITHATPAAFGAKTEDRGKWNIIATQYIYESRPDILLGGGLRFWLDDQAAEYPVFVSNPAKDSHRVVEHLVKQGLTEAEAKADDGLLDDAMRQGYKTIHTDQELRGLNTAALFREGKKVLGLFAMSHMAYEVERKEKAPHEPQLATMTDAAIAYLSQDKDGFFLMVEGGRIDHAQHGNLPKHTIYDTMAFDQAVRVALDFQRRNPNTLVIVTSDHDTGGMAVEWPRLKFPAAGEIPLKDIDLERKEREATMTTRELLVKLDELNATGALGGPEIFAHIKRLLYRDGVWASGDHTAVDVPIMAVGPGAERVSGRMDNTAVFEVIRKAISH